MKIRHWFTAIVSAHWSAIALATSTLLGSLQLPAGDYVSFATDPVLHRAYSVNATSGTLLAMDTDALQVVGAATVDADPVRVRVDSAHHRVYVLHGGAPGQMTTIDGKSLSVVARTTLAANPIDLAMDLQRGEIYVIHDNPQHHFTIFDTKVNAVAAMLQLDADAYGLTVDRTAGKIYVPQYGARRVAVISQGSRTIVKSIPVDMFPVGAVAEEKNGSVFVSGFANLDASAVDQIAVLDTAADVVRNGVCCVTLSLAGVGRFDPIPSSVYGRTYFADPQLRTITVADARDGKASRTIGMTGYPVVRLVDADDGEVYVVDFAGSDTVTIIDARLERVVGTMNTGLVKPFIAHVGGRILLFGSDVAGNGVKLVATSPYGLQSGTAIATGFHHAGFDHYFHTSSEEETHALQDGIFGRDWIQTHEYLRVWTTPGPGRVPVCRFFSSGFGARSSHFYTPYASECEDLRKGTTWTYEGTSYYVALPTPEGACAAGLAQLYRLYNDGMGDAPNHAYTSSRAMRDTLKAQGWVPEGAGPEPVYACIPPVAGWVKILPK